MVQVLHSGVVAVLTTFGDQIAPDLDSAIVVPEFAVYSGDFEEEIQSLVWIHLEVSLKCLQMVLQVAAVINHGSEGSGFPR
jgi:hypothetical protein